MGTLFYQIWKLTSKKIHDVSLWNLLVVPITATQGVYLPQVTMEHIHSIIGYFTGIPS